MNGIQKAVLSAILITGVQDRYRRMHSSAPEDSTSLGPFAAARFGIQQPKSASILLNDGWSIRAEFRGFALRDREDYARIGSLWDTTYKPRSH
jgi:hypothetical protein